MRDPRDQLEIDIARLEAKQDKRDWLKGPKITKADLRNKTNGIEAGIPLRADEVQKSVLKFGKHRGKTYEEVFKADKQYFMWACMNIQGFLEIAKKEVPNYEEI